MSVSGGGTSVALHLRKVQGNPASPVLGSSLLSLRHSEIWSPSHCKALCLAAVSRARRSMSSPLWYVILHKDLQGLLHGKSFILPHKSSYPSTLTSPTTTLKLQGKHFILCLVVSFLPGRDKLLLNYHLYSLLKVQCFFTKW